MGFLRWTAGFLIALALTAFAVLNTQNVSVTFSPFHPDYDMPLYLVGVVLCATGFLIGAATVWLNFSGLRRIKRQQRKQIKALERELDVANENGAADPLPALPRLTKR